MLGILFTERAETNFFKSAAFQEYFYNCFTLLIVSSILAILYLESGACYLS